MAVETNLSSTEFEGCKPILGNRMSHTPSVQLSQPTLTCVCIDRSPLAWAWASSTEWNDHDVLFLLNRINMSSLTANTNPASSNPLHSTPPTTQQTFALLNYASLPGTILAWPHRRETTKSTQWGLTVVIIFRRQGTGREAMTYLRLFYPLKWKAPQKKLGHHANFSWDQGDYQAYQQ